MGGAEANESTPVTSPQCKKTVETATQTEVQKSGVIDTQTERCFVFKESDLVQLLVKHEHLLAQEEEARYCRIPHEPALQCTKRHLRKGTDVPLALPVSRPLKNPPAFRLHWKEKKWIDYPTAAQDSSDDEELSVTNGNEEVTTVKV